MDAAAAAATAPADMERASALSSDDEQQTEPNSKKRRRSTNTDLYELFTTEGVPGDPKAKQGTAFVHCKACVRHNETMAKENENRTADKYFLNKCYVRKDKFSLELFMALGNITSTNTEDDYDISFPELYEIYK